MPVLVCVRHNLLRRCNLFRNHHFIFLTARYTICSLYFLFFSSSVISKNWRVRHNPTVHSQKYISIKPCFMFLPIGSGDQFNITLKNSVSPQITWSQSSNRYLIRINNFFMCRAAYIVSYIAALTLQCFSFITIEIYIALFMMDIQEDGIGQLKTPPSVTFLYSNISCALRSSRKTSVDCLLKLLRLTYT